MAKIELRNVNLVAYAVLAAGALLTLAAWRYTVAEVERSERYQFDFRAGQVAQALDQRMRAYTDILYGLQGFFLQRQDVTPGEFHRYLEKTRIRERYPGIRAVGFVPYLKAGEKAAFEQRMAKDRSLAALGYPRFAIHPPGDRADYYPVAYLEPLRGNEQALGFDIGSESVRREAALRARDTGQAAATGPITLVHEPGRQTAFLLTVPLYRQNLPLDTVERRRRAFYGLAYMAFRTGDLVRGAVSDELLRQVGLRISDYGLAGQHGAAGMSLYASDGAESGGARQQAALDVGGRQWRLALTATAPMVAESELRRPWWTLAFGGVSSFLLFAVVRALAGSRRRAVELAGEMTHKLRESETRTRAVLDNVLDGVVTIDESGAIHSFNRSAERIFGYGAEEMIGRNVKLLMPEPDRGRHDDYLAAYCRTGHKKVVGVGREVQGQRKDGELFPMNLSVTEMLFGQQRFFVGLVRDISQSRKVEEELRTSQANFAKAQQLAHIGNWLWDLETDRLTWSDEACRIFGHAPQSFVPTLEFLRQAVHPDDRNALFQALDHAIKDGVPFAMEHRVVLPNGSVRYVSALGEVVYGDDGKPLQMRGTAQDITERKMAQEEISRFKNVLDNTLDMIFMFDPDSLRIVYLNKGMEEGLGYSREELLGMEAYEIKPLMPEQVFRSHIAPLLSGDRQWLSYETTHRRKDGSDVPVEEFLQMVRQEDGQGLFVAVARDLTERRRVDKLKSEFISTVSHELRTPMTSIRGSLGLVMGGVAGELPPQARSMVEIAYNNSERLVRLINDILDMDKIESGKMRLDVRTVELLPLLEQSLEANRAYGEQYGVKFALHGGEEGIKVRVDSDRLLQVMANLLSNAAKFSPAGGEVEISVAAGEKNVRVAVKDHGPGIPQEFRERIFRKFSQADSSDARRKGGTGLGLSICKALVERMNGGIGFTSKEGEGSTFFFDLPLVKGGLPGPSQRLLVCEDNSDVATQLKQMLARHGYRVDVASSAEAAKGLLARNAYSAMTLDLMLPGQDGLSLVRELQAEGFKVPVVVISAVAGERRDDSVSVLEWLEKPVRADRLLEVLKNGALPPPKPLILHVEDEEDIRRVLHGLLGGDAEVIGAGTKAEAEALLGQRNFDLVVLDIGLPDGSGLEVLDFMAARRLAIPVVLFSAHETGPEVNSRVAAVLVKSRSSNKELEETIHRVMERRYGETR